MSQRIPKISETPAELFTYNPDIIAPYLDKFWGPGICATLGLTGQAGANSLLRRPIYSGLSRFIGLGIAGLVVGYFLDKHQRESYAEYDAVVRHYISLHPDDFPPFQRQKFSEVFIEWYPIR